jgi:hypothetical protein
MNVGVVKEGIIILGRFDFGATFQLLYPATLFWVRCWKCGLSQTFRLYSADRQRSLGFLFLIDGRCPTTTKARRGQLWCYSGISSSAAN